MLRSLKLRRRLFAMSLAGIILGMSFLSSAQTNSEPAIKTGYAPVNGLRLYYEIFGAPENR